MTGKRFGGQGCGWRRVGVMVIMVMIYKFFEAWASSGVVN